MRTIIVSIAALLCLAACQPKVPEAPNNLVLICVDTVRYDSILGRQMDDAFEPWLKDALHFTNASSTAPWTMPAVSSLLTGLYPIEHGAGRFAEQPANLDVMVPSALDEAAITLPDILSDNYWRAAAFVAHPFFKADLGIDQGFQQVHMRRGWWRNLDAMWKWMDRIKQPARKFGYLHFMEAHHRHTGSNDSILEWLEPVSEEERDEIRALWPDNCEDQDSRRCLQSIVYEAAVRELRTGLAAVFEGLDERGMLEDTIVVLYSDHGEEFWDHEEVQLERGEDPRPELIGLGHGQSMYQELIHVPLLVWHPGLEGRKVEENVSLVDVVPSLLRWLDIDTTGMSFSGQEFPVFRNNWLGGEKDRTVFASGIAYGPEQVATRHGEEKSIFRLQADELEVFDLATDPKERAPSTDQGLSFEFGTLSGDYLELPMRIAGEQGELDADQIEQLKAIGYLQGVEEEPATTTKPVEADSEGNEEDSP